MNENNDFCGRIYKKIKRGVFVKKLLSKVLGLSLVLTMALSGCSNAASSTTGGATSAGATATAGDKVTISFVNGFTGGDGPYMTKIVDGFNQSQDKYFIEQLQTDDHYTKFKSDDFDMLIIHADMINTFYQDGLIQDVSGIYTAAGLTSDDFDNATKPYALIDGKQYAFPLDIYSMTMFYNKEYVSEAPKTYDDLLALRDTLDSENSNLYVMGIPQTGDEQWFWTALMYQSDTSFENGEYLVMNTQEVADNFVYLNNMIYKDKLSASNLGANDNLNTFMKDDSDSSSRSVLALMGPWNYPAAKERYGDNLGVASIPTLIGSDLKIPSGGHNFAVSSKVTDQAKLDGMAEFFKYAYTPENMINWADSGQAPVHVGTMELVKQSPETYVVANVTYGNLSSTQMPPLLYNIREQIKYPNTVVYGLAYSTPGVTADILMPELETATNTAKELSEKI